jgi:hypothetical protein
MKGVGIVLLLALGAALSAQGRPGGPAPAPLTPKAAAPVDLTGTWVSVVTEDWLMRMVTPKKGDYESVPLNPEGIKVADSWDVSQDGLCSAYGVGGIMRMPGRVRISWTDDRTLKIETDAGQQTRLLHFGGAPPTSGERTLQGYSVAEWAGGSAGNLDPFTRRNDGPGAQQWGVLRVRTTYVRPGWLRRNGVPYSQNAVVMETFTRFTHPQAGDWFVVTTTVEDPTYLSQPFSTSTNFRKEPSDARWSPAPCRNPKQ